MKREQEERVALLSQNKKSGLDLAQQKITEFQSHVAQIQNLTKDIGTGRDGKELRIELQERRLASTRIAKELSGLLSAPQDSKDKQKHQQILGKFTAGMKTCTDVCKLSIEKEKQYPLSRLQTDSDSESSSSVERGGAITTQQQKMKSRSGLVEQDATEVDREIIEETNREFRKLEGELSDLVDTFAEVKKELGEQGEALNVVENQVDAADAHVQEAVSTLEDAYEYQQSSRKKLACIIITITILVLAGVIALIIILVLALKK